MGRHLGVRRRHRRTHGQKRRRKRLPAHTAARQRHDDEAATEYPVARSWLFPPAAGADDADPWSPQGPAFSRIAERSPRQLEVSPKTIQRDIDFMRYRLGLPIEYDPLRFGFYYSEPVTAFPNIEVSEGEITALFVAQKALAQYKGTPFEQPLRTAFRKITDGLTDRVAFSWSDLDSVISFHSVGSSPADLETFENISKAVLRSVEIHFKYRKLRGRDYELRLLQPYHLACLENQWYFLGTISSAGSSALLPCRGCAMCA